MKIDPTGLLALNEKFRPLTPQTDSSGVVGKVVIEVKCSGPRSGHIV